MASQTKNASTAALLCLLAVSFTSAEAGVANSQVRIHENSDGSLRIMAKISAADRKKYGIKAAENQPLKTLQQQLKTIQQQQQKGGCK